MWVGIAQSAGKKRGRLPPTPLPQASELLPRAASKFICDSSSSRSPAGWAPPPDSRLTKPHSHTSHKFLTINKSLSTNTHILLVLIVWRPLTNMAICVTRGRDKSYIMIKFKNAQNHSKERTQKEWKDDQQKRK